MQLFYVKNQKQGVEKAKEIIHKESNTKTALFLSGGSTPRDLYTSLANENLLKLGAAALVDERFIEAKFQNQNSKLTIDGTNEKMIADTGFLKFLEYKNIRFFPILQTELSLEDAAVEYDETVRYLINYFPKTIAVMGIGEDGHTAGLPAGVKSLKLKVQSSKFVDCFTDFPGEYKNRITLTFKALEMIDLIIILVFGKNKKKALKKMFIPEKSEDILPARFYTTEKISKKTILITDQQLSL